MTLHTTPDFADALLATAQALKLPEAFVEKDYWVTDSAAGAVGLPLSRIHCVKGGTALSKAYGLVQRFSEDVDLALTDDETRTSSKTKSLMDKGAKHITQCLPEVKMRQPVAVRGLGEQYINTNPYWNPPFLRKSPWPDSGGS